MSHDSRELTVTGGVRIGWVNATWPLAKLRASHEELVLTGLLGTTRFVPSDIAALEPYSVLPLLGRGIRIVHTRSDVAEKIVFWCLGSPERLIDQIASTGFRGTRSVLEVPQRAGFPLRWTAVLAIVLGWNVLFLLDGALEPGAVPGTYAVAALVLMFLLASTLPYSARLQGWVMKPGRSIGEVRSPLTLVQIISGVLAIAFAFDLFSDVVR